MRKATAEADDWRCSREGGLAPGEAAPPFFDESGLLTRQVREEPFIEAREIVRLLRDCGLSDATIAQVIGITRGKLRAWEASLVRPVGIERLQDLARIVGYFLKGASAPREVGRWLCSPNRHLGGRCPIAVLAGRSWPW